MPRRLYSVRNVGAYLAHRDDGWFCHYCGCAVHRDPSKVNRIRKPEQATIDHKTPLCKGGDDGVRNMVLACYPCNEEKGEMDYAEFCKLIKAKTR